MNQVSIIVASIIIGASIIFFSFQDRYQLAIGGTKSDISAWRINKHTGQVVACQITYDPFAPAVDFLDAPSKPQSKPMVIIECGDD